MFPNRHECLFCSRSSICKRETNPIIVQGIEKNGLCVDRIPIWINPSERTKFHEYDNPIQIIGDSEPIDLNPNFIPNPKFIPKKIKIKKKLKIGKLDYKEIIEATKLIKNSTYGRKNFLPLFDHDVSALLDDKNFKEFNPSRRDS